jgi:Ca-activated chloride channel family protein
MLKEVSFLNPEFFWLFLLLPAAILWHIWKRKQLSATLKISSVKGFKAQKSWIAKLKPYLFVLRLLALSSLIIALARPRKVDISSQTKSTKGIDIVMAIDVYAAEAYTKNPVTSDKAVVQESLRGIKYDNVIQDGTGIGMGLTTAVNRLKDSKAKSKVIILLTDGVNNAGFIEPETASQIAKEYGIKVYTIGIGTNGNAMFPYAYAPNGGFLFKMMPVEIDVNLLQAIARNTGGKYYRANSNDKLESIYNEINKLETTEIQELKFYDYDEKYRLFVWIALVLVLIEIGLRNTVYRSFI